MTRLRQFFRPLLDSHPIGLIVAVLAFVGMADVAAAAAMIPGSLGFAWQAGLLGLTPLLCVVGCVIVSILAPVGNHSRSTLLRAVGRVPVLGRYFLFAIFGCSAVLLGAVSLHLVTSSSIQSLTLQGNVPTDARVRIQTDVGEGIAILGAGDKTRVFFLKEKREAVERAFDKEGIAPGE